MTRKQLFEACDDLCRELAVKENLLKFGGVCELCKKRYGTQWHHIFGRGGAVRFLVEGQSWTCDFCHPEAKSHREFIRGMYAGIRGLDWYKRMSELEKQTKSWKAWELIELRQELKGRLEELKNAKG